MSIEVVCGCGRRIVAQDQLAGKKVRCPGCSQPVEVPAQAGDAPASPKPKSESGIMPAKPAQPGSGARKAVAPPAVPGKAPGKTDSAVRKPPPVPAGDGDDIPVIRAKKKGKGKKKANTSAGLILGVALGVLALVGGGAGLYFSGLLGGGGAGNSSTTGPSGGSGGTAAATTPKPGTIAAAMNATSVTDNSGFLPGDSFAFFTLKVGAALQTPLGKSLLESSGVTTEVMLQEGSIVDPAQIQSFSFVVNNEELAKNRPGGGGGPGMMPPGAGGPGRGQRPLAADERVFISHEMEQDTESSANSGGLQVAQIGGAILPPRGGTGGPAGGFTSQNGPPGMTAPGGPGGRPGIMPGGPGGPGMMPGGPGGLGRGPGGPGMMPGGPGMGGLAGTGNTDYLVIVFEFNSAQDWSAKVPNGATKSSITPANAPGTTWVLADGKTFHLCPGGKVGLLGTPIGLDKFLNLPSGGAKKPHMVKAAELTANSDNQMVCVFSKDLPGVNFGDVSKELPPQYTYLKPLLDEFQMLTLTGTVKDDLAITLTAHYPDETKAKDALAAAKKGVGQINTLQNKALLAAAAASMPGPQGKAIGIASDALGQLKPIQEGSNLKQVVTIKGAKLKALLPPAPAGGNPNGTVPGAMKPPSGGKPAGGAPSGSSSSATRPGPGGGFVSGASSGGSGGTVQAVRNAAQRGVGQAELKQVGLALMNTEQDGQSFPLGAICDPNGKPLLSWRVAILPALEQDNLFKKFKLDEPWDSPHNKELLQYMPKQFGSEPGYKTCMRAFVGPGCAMELYKKVRLGEITDGTSATAVIAEATEAVEWTKPEELWIAPGYDFPKLGLGTQQTVNVLMADGSVKRVPRTYTADQWKPLITRSGGEMVNLP